MNLTLRYANENFEVPLQPQDHEQVVGVGGSLGVPPERYRRWNINLELRSPVRGYPDELIPGDGDVGGSAEAILKHGVTTMMAVD
jgi:hypothetical protein